LGRPLVSLFPEIAERGLDQTIRDVIDHGVVSILAPALHHFLIRCAHARAGSHFQTMQQHVTLAPLRVGESIEGVSITIEDVTARMERERALAAQLESSDVTERLSAASTIAREQIGSPTSLIEVLGDIDWTVRRAAVEGLASHPSQKSRDALIAALREHHSDLAVLNAAISTIIAAPAQLTEEVRALLKGPDADLRAYSALALGFMNDAQAIPGLIELLADPDANVRFHAIEALGRLHAHGATDRLVAIARSDDFFGAFAAIDALAAIGDSSVATQLLPLLQKPELREAAVNALAGLGHESAAAPIAALLQDPDVDVSQIATALARLYREFEQSYQEGDLIGTLAAGAVSQQSAERLLAALENADDASVVDLVTVLGWLDFDGVDDAIAGLLGHPTAGAAAIAALVKRGSAAVDLLVGKLKDDDRNLHKSVALALGRIGSPRAVNALVGLLSDPPDVAAISATALGSIGAAEAFEPLAALLGHEHAAVRQAAVSAINSIGHPDTEQSVNALLQDAQPLVRESATKIAGYFGFPSCFEHVLERSEDPDARVRRVAIEHLVLFDDPRTIAAIGEAFASSESNSRAAAARAVAQLDSEQAAPLLGPALADPDLWVRYHAIRSLIALEIKGFDDTLLSIANGDPAVPVRSAAIEALGVLCVEAAAPMLAMLARNDEHVISVAAIEALGCLADPDGMRTLMEIAAGTNAENRRAALRSLARHADSTAVAEICGLALAQAGTPTMQEAIDALARARTPNAYGALVDLIRHPACRAPAISALAGVGFDVAPALERALRQRETEIRLAAVQALARMKDARAVALLTRALDDPAVRVRTSAEQALARFELKQRQPRFPRAYSPARS
jgi:HEAT repeat protein